MEYGTRMHEFFDDFYTQVQKKGFNTTIEEIKKEIYEPDKLNFISLNQGIYKALTDKTKIIPAMREEKIFDKKNNLVGIIDAVFEENGKCVVIDYKTGKYNPTHLASYRMELSIYHHLVKQKRPDLQITHWGIYFSKVHKLWKEPVDEKYFGRYILPKLEKIRASVRKGNLPPKMGPLCSWCSFRNKCAEEGGFLC